MEGQKSMELTPELEDLYTRWLKTIPPACSPHFYNLSHQHKTVFLMQRPLERDIPKSRTDVLAYVQGCRKEFAKWLAGNEYYSEMATVLSPAIGRELKHSEDLIENIYFTDALKCHGNAGTPHSHAGHNDSFLREEFDFVLKEATLFISIGAPAWEKISRLMGPSFKPVNWRYQHLAGRPDTSMTLSGIHGVLFEHSATGKFVIPLTFPPGGNSHPLRNSYLEYLKDGLAALAATTKR
jgi:hypothetical protein